MRAVVQRVRSAGVTVEGVTVGEIARGFCVLLGVETGDTPERARAIAARIAKLRIFDDASGKMNLALGEVGGEILLVSQFTLLGDCSGGNRPSFVRAAGRRRPSRSTGSSGASSSGTDCESPRVASAPRWSCGSRTTVR